MLKKPMLGRFLIFVLTSSAAYTASAQGLTEAAGAAQTCQAGPDAALARAQRLAGKARVTAASVLPNPSLVAEHQRALSGPTEHETVIGVAVPLSIGGRRSMLEDAARAYAEQAAENAKQTLFDSALQFRRAYAVAILDQARVTALTEQQAMLDAMSTTIEALAKGGEAAAVDLLRQRVNARLHLRTVQSAEARARGSLAFLETWLGTKVSLAPTPVLALAGGPAGDAVAIDGASAQHPSLVGLQAQQRGSALEGRAANRRWVPELELFGGYRTTSVTASTGHGLSLSLTVPLTFFDYGQGEAAIAEASLAHAVAEEAHLKLRFSARLDAATAELALLTKSSADIEQVSAEAATPLEKTRQLYTAGEASLTELLDAFRSLEDARLGVIELAEEIVSVRLERMAAAGTQLDQGLDKTCADQTRNKP